VTPALLHLDRDLIRAATILAGHRFEDRGDVPADVAAGLTCAPRRPSG
jgi:hypothetical protein